jgi:hypothetical protein
MLAAAVEIVVRGESSWQAVTSGVFCATPKKYPCKDKNSTTIAAIDI